MTTEKKDDAPPESQLVPATPITQNMSEAQRRQMIYNAFKARINQVVQGAHIPYGYELWKDGLWKQGDVLDMPANVKIPIPDLSKNCPAGYRNGMSHLCASPITVKARAVSLETGEGVLQMWTRTMDEDIERWETQDCIAKRANLSGLAKYRFPIDEMNASDVMLFFRKLMTDERNKGMFLQRMSNRLGYHQNDALGIRGWLMGEKWIGSVNAVIPDRRVMPAPINNRPAYGVRGSFAVWTQVAQELMNKYDHIAPTLGVAFASPLVRVLGMRSYIVHHSAGSGHAKTAAAKFALSIYGDATRISQSLYATNNGLIAKFQQVDDFGILADETEAMQEGFSLKELIYQYAGETTKLRAQQDGSPAPEGQSWKGIMRITGEKDLKDDKNRDLGGQLGRMITFEAQMAMEKEDTDLIYDFIEAGDHYGHAGVVFLESLAAWTQDRQRMIWLKDQHKLFRDRFLEHLVSILPNVSEKRLNNNALQLGCNTLGTALGLHWVFGKELEWSLEKSFCDVRDMMTTRMEASDYRDITLKGLDIINEHLQTSGRVVDLASPNVVAQLQSYRTSGKPILAYSTGLQPEAEIWIVKGEANIILKREKIPESRMWKELARNGLLKVHADKRTDIRRQLPDFGIDQRFYVIARKHLTGDVDESLTPNIEVPKLLPEPTTPLTVSGLFEVKPEVVSDNEMAWLERDIEE